MRWPDVVVGSLRGWRDARSGREGVGCGAYPRPGDPSTVRSLDTGWPGRCPKALPDNDSCLPSQELVHLGSDLGFEPTHCDAANFKGFAVAILDAA